MLIPGTVISIKNRIISANGPYFSIPEYSIDRFLGNMPKITLYPSNGGRGTRLKTARIRLICTKVNPNSIHISLNPNSKASFFKQNPIKIAVTKLEAGPAKDTIDMPNKGGAFLILYMSTGTGLPHPNPTNKNNKEPSGSR